MVTIDQRITLLDPQSELRNKISAQLRTEGLETTPVGVGNDNLTVGVLRKTLTPMATVLTLVYHWKLVTVCVAMKSDRKKA